MARQQAEDIKKAVKEKYAGVARRGPSCCGSAVGVQDGLANSSQRIVELYGEQVVSQLPDSVTEASAGCGNPLAIASLREGQVVVDLGSGGGIDCFLAAQQVGPQGRVIGIDMTPEMVALAKENARKIGAANVEFRLAEMEQLPIDTESVDVVLSNCVINLSLDKDAVFREAFRVLKPGGRLSISDIVTLGELPAQVRESYEAWAGCIGGALNQEVYLGKIRAAGFSAVTVESASDFDFQGNILRSARVTAMKPLM